MLILRRKEGQWVEITHRSGDTIRVRVCNVRARHAGQIDLAFDDDARHFTVQRPERAGLAHGLSVDADADVDAGTLGADTVAAVPRAVAV